MFEHGLFRSEDVVEPLFPEHVTARLEDKTIALNLINDFHGVAGWNLLVEVIFWHERSDEATKIRDKIRLGGLFTSNWLKLGRRNAGTIFERQNFTTDLPVSRIQVFDWL